MTSIGVRRVFYFLKHSKANSYEKVVHLAARRWTPNQYRPLRDFQLALWPLWFQTQPKESDRILGVDHPTNEFRTPSHNVETWQRSQY